MPIYNGEEYLSQVLSSIEAQSFRDFRLYICDNASTDKTAEICLDFCARNVNFVYKRFNVHVDGMSNSIRAYELTNKKSEYFVFVHDDNVYDLKFLEMLSEYLDANKKAVVCGFFVKYISKDGRITARHRSAIPVLLQKSKLLYFAFEWRSNANTFILHFMMRRAALDAINLNLDIEDFPERYLIAQLRSIGEIYVLREELATFNSGGIGEVKSDPWVRSRTLLKFGEKELSVLKSFSMLSNLDNFVLGNSFCFVSLRHRVPGTVWRWWLLPAYISAQLVGLIKR
jgi:glycosyltransferase involved in cell wall biosynthesis